MKYLTPKYETELIQKGQYSRIIGIDEVGRGCWAGPVAVGAYFYVGSSTIVRGVHDSKKLVLQKREKAYSKLRVHDYKVLFASVDEIDSVGIGKTIERLIETIVNELTSPSTYFLIDGKFSKNFGPNAEKIIDGDSLHYSIAAASILAKVERDNLMRTLDLEYPDYGFAKHKGYGTKFHREAIYKNGICELHRKSFKPINDYL